MIDHLDNLLRHLMLDPRISEITTEAQVRFRPPDEDWRNEIVNLQQPALNLYLFDLRENRKLRTNARVRNYAGNGQVTHRPAPARLDCHYVITAWNPAQPGPAVEPTLDEHALLYKVAGVLFNEAPLNPSRIYPPGSAALSAVPEVIRDADLPTQLLPVEGFPKLAEFWGTMGANHRWKPAIYLIVTLPVVLDEEIAGPMVTTTITEYRQTGRPETAETWIEIGGHVLDAIVDPTDPVGVPAAWVQLARVGGEPLQTATTDAQGRFKFHDLQPGQYQLAFRAEGYPAPAAARIIDVPSPSGEYDLKFE